MLMAAVALFIAFARGSVICFCNDDPDDCGHACHECGHSYPDGISAGEACHHLDLSTLDVTNDGEGDTLPVLSHVTAMAFTLDVILFAHASQIKPCAASPPLGCALYCSYSTRLFPFS